MGWPLVTGPIILIIFLQDGADFAAKTAHGSLLGQISLVAFAWCYALVALRAPWYVSIACATVTFIGSVYLVSLLHIPLWLTLIPVIYEVYRERKFKRSKP